MTQDKRTTTVEEWLAGLATTPDVYPQKLDLARDAVLALRVDVAVYRNASFLDDRILGPATRGSWLPLPRVLESAAAVRDPRPLNFILHTGHVGSTLLSRLLDDTGRVLSVREPLPMRTLAEAQGELGEPASLLSQPAFDALLEALLRLWSRGYDGTRAVVVKATSSAATLAPAILARRATTRAVYLNLRAEPALATLLAGQNTRVDLRGHGPQRIRRLRARLACTLAPLHAMSAGELAAMSWLAESLCRQDLLERHAASVLDVDFDALLADVPGQLGRVTRHFGLAVDAEELARIAAGPALSRYSKAPEHDYGPALRAQLLAGARQHAGEEIRRGLAWLEGVGRAETAVARLLDGPRA